MDADVIIVGAGPAGLSLARVLGDAGLQVRVLEKQPRAALAEPAFDGREIALTHTSRRHLIDWGIWDHLPADGISDLRHARVFDDGLRRHSLDIEARLGDRDQLGWLVPNQDLRRAAWLAVEGHPGITVETGLEVSDPRVERDAASVALQDGRRPRARLLVAADSRFSATRRALGIPARVCDYGKSMMVFRVRHERPHHHQAWEWFGHGQTRALLPLNGDRASVVLTLPATEMERLLALDDDAFDQDITRRYQGRLGAMTRISERHVYPLVGVYASRFHGPRFALVGDAAVGMHPVTAHGFNLGLSSVAHLAARLAPAHRAGRDPGAADLLESYHRAHRRGSLPLFNATHLVVSLYTDDRAPARLLRGAALKAANTLTPFKRLIARQVTG
ncbi:5-demethoxyubiquinol-8 5-hydroxylase UbiM [Alloalcanivorax profundimaris]|uniref:5-demethoxyubiquinol-8 5-hydroxylase UbiM n=1 Tax=Alloalcanivorax profundimaris TaxID=2735259 RepID=UPI001887B767|nr:5-demethoxyubiquinol-8 5-hydroxylase UbiM [Alloalcanivorax profundimaris]MBF1800477.1 5-demethoxyubiquinol-8 5-hydroxylase UbiM [Alloalcanivorax profundimaris]